MTQNQDGDSGVGYNVLMPTLATRTIIPNGEEEPDFVLDSPWMEYLTHELTLLEEWKAAYKAAEEAGEEFFLPKPTFTQMYAVEGVVSTKGQTFYLQSLG